LAELFDDIFKESKIFSKREVLSPHYIPHNLLFRDKQMQDIAKYMTPSLKGERGRNVFVYGKTGTGKTSCIKSVIEKVKGLPISKARITYINCRVYNSRYRILHKIVSDYLPLYAKRGYGIVDIYERIINWIEEDGKILVVVLDEIDSIKDLDDLVYTLTRANSDIKAGGITIVGVSNKVSFKEVLDPRSLSTLDENEIAFPPYNSNELSQIVKERVSEGFVKGVVDPAAVNLAAALAAKDSGDARLALKIIAKAGELAEEKGMTAVGPNEVTEAAKFAEEEIAYEIINTLPEHQRLIVYAIALLSLQGSRYKRLSNEGEQYLFSGDIYQKYVSVSQSLQKEAKSSRWYRKFISDLDMQGIIMSYESGKGIRGHTKLIKLAYPADRTKEVLEKDLFGVNVR
jgi:cell division control protein 6